MGYVLMVVLGYLLGSSNMTWYLAKIKKVDLTSRGSGNLGTSNATIVLGWKAGILTGMHDIGKGVLAVVLARILFPQLEHVGAAAGAACVWGHIFPFYLRFRGGKGFAPFLGMTLALNWKFALAVLAIVVLITLVTDYLVIGTFTTIAVVPAWTGFVNGKIIGALIILAASLVILYEHRENITRLRNGTEIGLKSTLRGDHRVKSEK